MDLKTYDETKLNIEKNFKSNNLGNLDDSQLTTQQSK